MWFKICSPKLAIRQKYFRSEICPSTQFWRSRFTFCVFFSSRPICFCHCRRLPKPVILGTKIEGFLYRTKRNVENFGILNFILTHFLKFMMSFPAQFWYELTLFGDKVFFVGKSLTKPYCPILLFLMAWPVSSRNQRDVTLPNRAKYYILLHMYCHQGYIAYIVRISDDFTGR